MVLLVALMLWGWLGWVDDPSQADRPDDDTDAALYSAVVDSMRADGLGYYESVALHHADRGYPTRPVLTVREPALATVQSTIGTNAAEKVLWVLVGVLWLVALRRFDRMGTSRTAWIGATILLGATATVHLIPVIVMFHETWAGVLLAMGLLLHRRDSTNGISAVLILLAALVREFAAPVLLLLALLAWRDDRRRETGFMLAALLAWAAYYGWHAIRVLDAVPGDADGGGGWLAFGGWPFTAHAIWVGSVFILLPALVGVVFVPLALLGWWGRTDHMGTLIALVLSCYAVGWMVVGRENNLYWGLLIGLLVMPGLAFVPRAARDICRGALRGRREVGQHS